MTFDLQFCRMNVQNKCLLNGYKNRCWTGNMYFYKIYFITIFPKLIGTGSPGAEYSTKSENQDLVNAILFLLV
jgi:hypothetical protein